MNNNINTDNMLRVGTVLHGTYCIGRYLSSGGFGNTYVAMNIQFGEQYAIKEFFMRGISQRDNNNTTVSVSNTDNRETFASQLEKFKKEARRLRKLNNEHIVRVHDLFEENGTAYYVMDYIDGENLSDRLKRTGKPLSEAEVMQLLPQILDALEAAHKEGILHLDLKPANIMVDKQGVVKLIDFGASKQQSAQGGATTSTAVSYTNGYAPREQMEQNLEKFGPWTDFYALGATLYTLLTNKKPPLPSDIDDDGSEDKHLALPMPSNCSEKLRNLVLWLMSTNRISRPQSVEQIYLKLKNSASLCSTITSRNNDEENTVVFTNAKLKSSRKDPKGDVDCFNAIGTFFSNNKVFTFVLMVLFILGCFGIATNNSIGNSVSSNSQNCDTIVDPELSSSVIKKENGSSSVIKKEKERKDSLLQIASKEGKSVTGRYNGHDYVDLGLSVKWGTANVGATKPEEYGNYYAWGETTPQIDNRYTSESYKFEFRKGKKAKYKVHGKHVLQPEDDAAHKNWGGKWRIPTIEEVEELCNKCSWVWTTRNGIRGYLVINTTNGNNIFLPAAGERSDGRLNDNGNLGYYWSASLNTDWIDYACDLFIQDDYYSGTPNHRRYIGHSVRPVIE